MSRYKTKCRAWPNQVSRYSYSYTYVGREGRATPGRNLPIIKVVRYKGNAPISIRSLCMQDTQNGSV